MIISTTNEVLHNSTSATTTATTQFSHRRVSITPPAPTSGKATLDADHVTSVDNSSAPTPPPLAGRATSAFINTSFADSTRLPAAMFASPTAARYQGSSDGLPVPLLWLPYVALTLLLSALLVASFVHFHCKNGHKYKKRRLTNGNADSADDTGSTSTARHVAFSDVQSPTPTQGVSVIDCTSAVTCFRYTSPPIGRRAHPVCWPDEDDNCDRRRRKCNGDVIVEQKDRRVARKGDISRLSVEFVANRNGSMVNMRCTDSGPTTASAAAASKPEDAPSTSGWTCRTRPATAPKPSRARIAPTNSLIDSLRARGWRSEKASTSTPPTLDWPNGALYSAMRICQMDDTVDDWNRLVACSNP